MTSYASKKHRFPTICPAATTHEQEPSDAAVRAMQIEKAAREIRQEVIRQKGHVSIHQKREIIKKICRSHKISLYFMLNLLNFENNPEAGRKKQRIKQI